jgi:hypothetical protein
MKLMERVRIAFNVLVGKTSAPVLNHTHPERQPMQRRTRGQRSWGLSRPGANDQKQNGPNPARRPNVLQEHRSEECSESNRYGSPVEGRNH